MRVRLKSNGDYWQAFCKGHPARSLGNKRDLSRRAAEERCRQWEFELRAAGQALPPAAAPVANAASCPAPRLAAWLERYDALRTELSDGTRDVNRYCGEYLKRFFADDPPIDQIDRRRAAEWRAALASGKLASGNEQRKITPGDQTVCKHVRAARRIFGEALAQDLVRINPFDRLRGTPAKPLREWAYLDGDRTRQILDACPSAAWRAFFGLLRYAGLRRAEAIRLRWVDVDFARNRMRVDAPGTIDKEDTKHRPRTVPIETAACPNGLAAILQAAFDAAPDGEVRVCESLSSTNAKSIRNLNARAAKIVKAAGVPRYAKIFHTLRKNAEQDWSFHFPLHVVSEWAGNSVEGAAAHYLRVPEELYKSPPPPPAPPLPAAAGN